jgi:uncharacterized protein
MAAMTIRRLPSWHAFIAAVVALVALAAPAAAQSASIDFPPLSGRVVDQAGVLDADARAALASRLAAFEAQTSDQLVVAIVTSLQGATVEDYANRLFRRWRLGRKDANNGVLLLVAPAEHKVRIEVGYGLEGTLTDAVAKLIIEDGLVPRLRAGRLDDAVAAGVDDIIRVLAGDAAEWQRRADAAASRSHVHDAGSIELPPVLGFAVIIILGAMVLAMGALVGLLIVSLIVQLLVRIHLLPQPKDRHGAWLWLNHFDPVTDRKRGRRKYGSSRSSDSSWSSSSSSSSSSDSFSGGGGSSGGGGASGSW